MKIIINSPKYGEKIVLIDDEDYEKIKEYNWSLRINSNRLIKTYGAESRRHNKLISMHRLLMDAPIGLVVDHINGDTLDNRKSNLRICTNKENCRNSKKPEKVCSSYYKGVSFNKRLNKYQSYIKVNYKRYHLGYFKNQDQAAIAYNIAAVKYFGEFAKPNINIMMTKNVHLE